MVVCAPTYVADALEMAALAPWKSPPTSTVPPPIWPLASTCASPVRPTWSPRMWTLPPSPAPRALVVLPASRRVSLVARNTMRPFSPTTALSAFTMPRWFTSAP